MQVEQSRFTLRFRHPGLEKTYQDRVYRSSLAKMRLGIVLAIVLFSAFALVDPVVSPENVGRSRFIRFGVALPTFLAMGALSYSAFLKSRLQLVFFVFGLSMAGFATVLFSEGEFAKFLYPAALLLFFLSTYLLSALSLFNATLICVVMMVAYTIMTSIRATGSPSWSGNSSTTGLRAARPRTGRSPEVFSLQVFG
jgi:hypothetical protein